MGEDDKQRMIAEVAKRLSGDVDRELMKGILYGGQTNSVAQPEPKPLNVERMIEEWDKTLRNLRRTQITFVVDAGHEGPILKHETPTDGARVEMSWRQANELHQHWPLRLSQVNSPEQAEFVPASGVFPEFVPRILPMPPYDMPSEETMEEWWGFPKPPSE